MTFLGLWLSTFGLIFAIIDPFGYVPVFLTMTATDTDQRRREMLRVACLTAFGLLSFFTLMGNYLLVFFGISIPALQISGGLILLAIAFEMLKVNPVGEKLSESETGEAIKKEDISIVPLAIPMLSGPASITTVVVLSAKERSVPNYLAILISIAATLLFTYLILRSANRILHFIGITGLNVLTRVMGLLLCAMAVQFVINGYIAVR
jgi:multiple antibiotic resistance protein